MADLIDEVDLSLPAVISRIESALKAGPTAGPWLEGHLCDDNHRCNCGSILSDTGIMGAVATVHHDNGLPVGEGGNDAPPKSEAKANQLLISACHPLAIELLLKTIEDQASIIDRVKHEASRTPERFRVTYSNPDGGEATLQRHSEGEFVTFDTYSKVVSLLADNEEAKHG
ncbi:hypothetical protein [Rhizobium sp. MHM7A]|uniref:hypothetical protein n=1 Tax=Rhizobium sp. MHM7A TaxID=2583233 RepID=UPI0011062DC3|nr:hypothetical protein [Rhizobium sp. MHM7A]TLX17092.1 hypothetical protein FFR93_07195 [Rhizobium sp. MHM7A]